MYVVCLFSEVPRPFQPPEAENQPVFRFCQLIAGSASDLSSDLSGHVGILIEPRFGRS